MHIVFWQNIPSIHQAPFLKALDDLCQKKFGTSLTIICEEDVSEDRKSIGWSRPDYGGAKVIIQPNIAERQTLLEQNKNSDCYHIFSGFDMTPQNNQTLKSAIKMPCKTGVYLERPQNYPALRAIIRKCKYFYYARKYSAVDYIFAIGNMAADYYRERGFKETAIHPFAYFVENSEGLASPQTENNIVKFLYVGRNIPLKRIDLIIQALENLSECEWHIDFIGVSQEAYSQYKISEAIRPRVSFRGVMPNEETKEIMASSDALILPSRYDGWGAVVSEALMNGTRAIVSSQVGAKDLIDNAQARGSIFQAQSADDLEQTMREAIHKGPLSLEDRQKIKDWAERAIAPESGAEYFLECLQYAAGEGSIKPVPPWA